MEFSSVSARTTQTQFPNLRNVLTNSHSNFNIFLDFILLKIRVYFFMSVQLVYIELNPLQNVSSSVSPSTKKKKKKHLSNEKKQNKHSSHPRLLEILQILH